MAECDLLLRNVELFDGSGAPSAIADVAVSAGRIHAIGADLAYRAGEVRDGLGLALAPGFIDAHTHDDLAVIRKPDMLPKLSQGVTTVVVGNCGVSAAPVLATPVLAEPMNLLGEAEEFRYPTFRAYVEAVRTAQPAVNVAALVGHTALRSNHMRADGGERNRLDREATPQEIAAMRTQLNEALENGALGLSTGLAYLSAVAASTAEVLALAEPLAATGALYATHLRSETEAILPALQEAFTIGRVSQVPVIVSHLKCAGIANWGRAGEVLAAVDAARAAQPVGWDCYPYAAGSSSLDLRQVDPRVRITITWSTPHPDAGGRTLEAIASEWGTEQLEAARRLQPAGAIYHSIDGADMRRILAHPATMIGSDGLPNDPHPHPRLWGTFPRVLGPFCRDEQLFSLAEAISKMTALAARRFQLHGRGLLRTGYAADMVLFNPATIRDRATFADPIQPAEGIEAVWVNGVLSYTAQGATGRRAGCFLPRGAPLPDARSSGLF